MNCTKCGAALDSKTRFCTLCGTPISPSVQKPVTPPTSYQKWEYHWELRSRKIGAVNVNNWDNNILDKLLDLGEQGWELVSVAPRNGMGGEGQAGFTSEEMWVFKRPK